MVICALCGGCSLHPSPFSSPFRCSSSRPSRRPPPSSTRSSCPKTCATSAWGPWPVMTTRHPSHEQLKPGGANEKASWLSPLDTEQTYRYRKLVGMLRFIAPERPDLLFEIGVLSQGLRSPTHWRVLGAIASSWEISSRDHTSKAVCESSTTHIKQDKTDRGVDGF